MENYLKIIEKHFPIGKRDEVFTVVRFLVNAGVSFRLTKENINIFPEEPADVFVKDINKKFQISWADHDFFEKEGKASRGNIVSLGPRDRRDVFREYIIRPLNKKAKYRGSAKGISYLIRAPFNPPWIKEDLENLRKTGTNSMLKKMGFDEIYLVCSEENLLIFP